MIVKRLRKEHNWSQEQLATLSGLSTKTIQRIESGQSASLETQKCLASVFEIELTQLTEEIPMIDKVSEKWKEQPLWFRLSLFGVRSRRTQVWFEVGFLFFGMVALFVDTNVFNELFTINFDRVNRYAAPLLILGAYLSSCSIRYGDNKQLW